MSRRKKSKIDLIGRPDIKSFTKIKNIAQSNKINGAFGKTQWLHPLNKKKWFFRYARRRQSILNIVGKDLVKVLDPKWNLPKIWTDHWSKFIGKSEKMIDISVFMNNTNEREWRTKNFDMKRLSKLGKAIGSKRCTSKSSISEVVKLLKKHIDSGINHKEMLECINSDGKLSVVDDNIKVYCSCDPWDFMRMASGKSHGSCLDILSGGHCASVPEIFVDENTCALYVEDKRNHGDLTTILCRMLLRFYYSDHGLVVAPDRLYGQGRYRPMMMECLRTICKDHGITLCLFSNYNAERNSQSTAGGNNNSESFRVWGAPCKFTKAQAYNDQVGSGQWSSMDGSNLRIPLFRFTREVLDEEA